MPIVEALAGPSNRQDSRIGATRQLLVLFDGKCGFCSACMRLADFHLEVASVLFIPFQCLTEVELSKLGVSEAQCKNAMHAIGTDNTVFVGAAAVNAILSLIAATRPWITIIMQSRTLLSVERAAYAFVANNRILISRLLRTTDSAALR